MSIIEAPTTGIARSIHVNQIIRWLRGNPIYSEPVSFTGISNAGNYALTVGNKSTGLGLKVLDHTLGTILMSVDETGTLIRGLSAGSLFRVKNETGATVFEVLSTQVNINNPIINGATISTPIILAGRIGDYLDITHNDTAGAPTSGQSRLTVGTDKTLKLTESDGTITPIIGSYARLISLGGL